MQPWSPDGPRGHVDHAVPTARCRTKSVPFLSARERGCASRQGARGTPAGSERLLAGPLFYTSRAPQRNLEERMHQVVLPVRLLQILLGRIGECAIHRQVTLEGVHERDRPKVLLREPRPPRSRRLTPSSHRAALPTIVRAVPSPPPPPTVRGALYRGAVPIRPHPSAVDSPRRYRPTEPVLKTAPSLRSVPLSVSVDSH